MFKKIKARFLKNRRAEAQRKTEATPPVAKRVADPTPVVAKRAATEDQTPVVAKRAATEDQTLVVAKERNAPDFKKGLDMEMFDLHPSAIEHSLGVSLRTLKTCDLHPSAMDLDMFLGESPGDEILREESENLKVKIKKYINRFLLF